MNIVVCVKVVPVSDSVVTITPDKMGIDGNNLKYDLNPYDEYALEAAIQLKEKAGGTIVAVSIGPERDSLGLKRALALGADRLIHIISDTDVCSDAIVVANRLAEEIRPLQPDLIFCGKQSIDTGNGLVGTLLAQLLGFPSITAITSLNLEGNHIVVTKETDAGKAVYEIQTPCLLTTEKGLNKPRYPSLKDIMLSRKKEVVTKNIPCGREYIQLLEILPPEDRAAGIILGRDIAAVPELIRRLREEARVI